LVDGVCWIGCHGALISVCENPARALSSERITLDEPRAAGPCGLIEQRACGAFAVADRLGTRAGG
jgi:hypothetical protein